MQDIWVFAIITIVLLWLYRRWLDRRVIMLCTKFPTKWGQMLIGFGYVLFRRGPIALINEDHDKYGLTYICHFGPYPVLVTADPIIIGDVFKQCTRKPKIFYDRLTKAMGRGLITINDSSWSSDRKIINPAFSHKRLMAFLPIFNEEVNKVLTQLDKDTVECTEKPLINYFRSFTLKIATRTTIGRNIDKTHHDAEQIVEATNEFLTHCVEMIIKIKYVIGPIRKFARLTYFRNCTKMLKTMRSLITEAFVCSSTKRNEDPSYENSVTTALDYMVKGYEQQRISAEFVTDDMLHLYLGSFETTSTSLYFILLMLGMHPECQQRAYEEICTLFPDEDDGNFNVTYEDIQKLVYLEMVMNETMRVLPLVSHVARQVVDNDLTLSNGIVLPKGISVLISIIRVHQSTEVWGPNAMKFDPENFLPANIDSKHPYSFIPFTKGIRFCVGWRYAQLSITVALAKLIKKYKFTAHCKLEDFVLENNIVTRIVGEPPVFWERRRKL